MVPEGFTLADVGEVYFHHGNADGPNTVGQGDGGVGISSWIHYHSIEKAIGFLQFVNQAAFMVRLVIIEFDVGENVL
jgi:hypothetical protein